MFEDIVREPNWQAVKGQEEKQRLESLLTQQAVVREEVMEAQWKMYWQQQQVRGVEDG